MSSRARWLLKSQRDVRLEKSGHAPRTGVKNAELTAQSGTHAGQSQGLHQSRVGLSSALLQLQECGSAGQTQGPPPSLAGLTQRVGTKTPNSISFL